MTSTSLLSLRLSLMLSVVLPLCLAFPHCNEGPCQKGQFLKHDADGGPTCQPCPPDTYMDQVNHMCGNCFHCMELKDYRNERAFKECTPESDRVVVCKEGYFRVPDGDPKRAGFCEKCTRCADDEIVAEECGLYNDTVCSKHPLTGHTATDGSRARSTLEDDLQDQKHKKIVLAGLTDNDTDVGRSLEEVLTAICIILLSFAIIFSVKLCIMCKREWQGRRKKMDGESETITFKI